MNTGVESQQFDFLMYHSLISSHVIFGNPAQKKQPLLFFFHANLITSHAIFGILWNQHDTSSLVTYPRSI